MIAQGEGAFYTKSQLMVDMLKFDDQIFVDEGVRKEHLEKAIALYGLDKNQSFENVRKLSEDGGEATNVDNNMIYAKSQLI